jgi:hypothetical protein
MALWRGVEGVAIAVLIRVIFDTLAVSLFANLLFPSEVLLESRVLDDRGRGHRVSSRATQPTIREQSDPNSIDSLLIRDFGVAVAPLHGRQTAGGAPRIEGYYLHYLSGQNAAAGGPRLIDIRSSLCCLT